MNKTKIIFISAILALGNTMAYALPYTAQQERNIYGKSENSDDASFAVENRFYIGGDFAYSMWNDANEDGLLLIGENTTSFDIMMGVRLADTFRLEANYHNISAGWNNAEIGGSAIFMNAILDARIDGIYRGYKHQYLVPYVGFGFGMAFLSSDEITIAKENVPALAALAGLAVEFNDMFALDFGYRYMYLMEPKIAGVPDFKPIAHQFRAGARLSF